MLNSYPSSKHPLPSEGTTSPKASDQYQDYDSLGTN